MKMILGVYKTSLIDDYIKKREIEMLRAKL